MTDYLGFTFKAAGMVEKEKVYASAAATLGRKEAASSLLSNSRL